MADDRISDKEIKTTLIHQSIEDYGRSCPCPYSKSPSGGQCGLNSAYSKTSRLTIFCYPSNVTNKMVKEYRDKNGL
jgi:negative regulator of genetic competence, sporulation and motility